MELHNYETGDFIRKATLQELNDSIEASLRDGLAGVITVNGVRCYVAGEFDTDVYYGNDESTYYVNQHGVIFCMQSPGMVGDFSKVTELPNDVVRLSLYECVMADIVAPKCIEDITEVEVIT